jgi:hypothetical protein
VKVSIRYPSSIASIVFAVGLLVSRDALAECTKDNECKGERICVDGACVDPPSRMPVATSAPAEAAEPARVAAAPSVPVERGADTPPAPLTERRSQALFVAGIVTMALTPVAALVAVNGVLEKEHCQNVQEMNVDMPPTLHFPTQNCSAYDGRIYGGAIAAVALFGGGLAMLLYGAKRVPVETKSSAMSFVPWTTGSATGLELKARF